MHLKLALHFARFRFLRNITVTELPGVSTIEYATISNKIHLTDPVCFRNRMLPIDYKPLFLNGNSSELPPILLAYAAYAFAISTQCLATEIDTHCIRFEVMLRLNGCNCYWCIRFPDQHFTIFTILEPRFPFG